MASKVKHNDVPIQELVTGMYEHIAAGSQVFPKWTCPACGERVCSDQPLRLLQTGHVAIPPGYTHTEREDGTPCGHTVDIHTHRFNCMLLISSHQQPTDWLSAAKGN